MTDYLVQTPRLCLRPWKPSDLDALVALNSDPRVHKWLGGPALAARSAESLQRFQEQFALQGWGVLHVEDTDGTFLGMAGLQPVRSHLPVAPATEAVWRFRYDAWGRGYASEAITAILEALPPGARGDIVTIIAAANSRSIKTAERIGFQQDPALDFAHPDLPENHPLRPHRVFKLQRDTTKNL